MVLKRILAYFIDCVFIFLYAVLLFVVNYYIHQAFDISMELSHPVYEHVISFFALTLPAFLYFFILESNSKRKGSLGKQFLNLKIINNSRKNIFIRVFFKLLPWEIAHVGIHWTTYYDNLGAVTPLWVWIVNFVPYILILTYLLGVIRSKGFSGFYDRLATTKVETRGKEYFSMD